MKKLIYGLIFFNILVACSSIFDTRKECVDLSAYGSANCYIVSSPGSYKFRAVQGNDTEGVGEVAFIDVLWESFGTDTAPQVGDLIRDVSYADGFISFEATKKKGNALIAAKDVSGRILWSWHIWMTEKPKEQVYFNGAGTMMDRNLGAITANLGDVRSLGLLYQWGRKDPFLGASDIFYTDDEPNKAASTGTWPMASSGDKEYAQEHPTTFLYNICLTEWGTNKTKYDPCPPGWRVPDGGRNGVWAKASGSSSTFDGYSFDPTNKGMNFSGKFGTSSMICYQTAGIIDHNGELRHVGEEGGYWSSTSLYRYGFNQTEDTCYYLYLDSDGFIDPADCRSGITALSVRCCKE